MTHNKKLIEVALPLKAINEASAREKSIRHGHPSTLHLWWARRPLAAARAVIFAQMVDDPSAHPDLFPTEKKQEKERQRLFHIIEELVKWENTTNEQVLQRARDEIWQSWRYTCAENADHPRAKELFDRYKLPAFHDPFAGGGALPLEAQRLGLESYVSDLNPVAVLINKAMIEIPPKFAGRPPVNPDAVGRVSGDSRVTRKTELETSGYAALTRPTPTPEAGRINPSVIRQQPTPHTEVGRISDSVIRQPSDDMNQQQSASRPAQGEIFAREWKGAQGLAEDVRYYGRWMRDEAEKRIGHLYPKIEVTAEMAQERPDLKQYVGRKLTVIAWLWARTVKSPNPAFADVDVPLASTFMLSTKKGKEAYVEPVIENGGYRFTVKVGKPKDVEAAKAGTKLSRGANFKCLMSDSPMTGDYIKSEGRAGRMGARLMAIVAEGDRSRVYLAPTPEHEVAARMAQPDWRPESSLPDDPRNFWTVQYGLETYGDLFTNRQLVALTSFSDLVTEARERIVRDAVAAGLKDEGKGLEQGGTGATAYAEAVGVYLGITVSRLGNRGCTISFWDSTSQKIQQAFGRQALPMTWDFCESNPFSNSSGNWLGQLDFPAKVVDTSPTHAGEGIARQKDAQKQSMSNGKVISTDPPYYDNIGYADLSDFFYVWLRRSLRPIFPELFATMAVPKAEELVATPYRHGNKKNAEIFFLDGMTQAMHRLAEQSHPAYPVTIYYAFKQSETKGDAEITNTGWDTFLEAVIEAGFAVSGTWPMRTELVGNLKKAVNALASSIILVCRQRPTNAPTATRREFVAALKAELPQALMHLQVGNIAPVDLAQAAIGPGMAVYTRYAKVLDAEGQPIPVRTALALINQVLDEALAEQEGDFDADTRWALTWFEQSGFDQGDYGVAEQLSKSKNTSVSGLAEAGILVSKAGKVRLLKPAELPADWDPASDPRLTIWEMLHQLIRALEAGGESAAAALVGKLGSQAETARELCYRLYTLCERKKRASEAMTYNGLVQSWPEIVRLAQQTPQTATPGSGDLFA